MARAMKDSGIEWIGEIPEGWDVCKQKHLITLLNGRAYSDDEFEENGTYRILRVGNLFSNPIWYTSSLELESDKYCEDGDLLYAWSMSYAPVIWHGEKVIYHYHIWKTRLAESLHKGFAYYYFIALTDAIMAEKHQTTMSFITMGVMNNSYIAFPQYHEQQRISSFLDTECAQIDAVIEKTRASIEEYKKLKQAVITEAVTKGIRPSRKMKDSGVAWIDSIPVEWSMERGKGLFMEVDNRSEDGSEELLTVSQYTGITPRRQKNVNMFEAETLEGYKIVEIGDIAANTMWLWAGAIGVSSYRGVISPSYNIYRRKGDHFDQTYLDYLLRAVPLVQQYESLSTGIRASRLRLYPQQFLSIRYPVPPMDEQKEIVGYLKEKIDGMDMLIQKKEQYLSEIESYKKSLIFEYVTGKKEI